MAKIYGINGVLSGKLGAGVYAVRNGEQVVRQYQPIVSNPSTSAQVAARAKLKLLSQLAAVMGNVIAFRRQGVVSARNIFIKENYSRVTFSNPNATIELLGIKLTRSVVSLPAIIATRGEGTSVTYGLTTGDPELSRVVYIGFEKTTDNELRYVASAIVSEPGADNKFTTTGELLPSKSYVYYAYGIRDNTDNARTIFGNMTVPTAEDVAKLIATRTVTDADITLTETRAFLLPAV